MDFFKSSCFSSLVEDLISQNHVPGLSIAVVQNDQIASAGYGKASLEPSAPCTADTLFDIASSAKSMTAASVALLVDDNENHPELQYDAIMSNLLPDDFVMAGVGYTEGVTVDDVLSHKTGMAPHDNSYFSPRAEHPDDARSITRNLRNLDVAAPIRAKYLYCNMMYTVATYLVEVKSKQTFADFLHERLFLPLGMDSSNLQPVNSRAKGLGDRIATGYIWNKETSYHGFQPPDCPEGQGAGSIITSTNDFIKWVKALINREDPINDKVYQGLVRMRAFLNQNPSRLRPYTSPVMYAAGMDVYYYRGYMVVGHNGVIPVFASRFFFIPDLKFGAVILGNSAGAGPVATILARKLIDEVLEVPEAERLGGNRSKRDTANPKNQSKDKGGNQPSGKGMQKTKRKQKHHSEPQEKPLDLYTGQYWSPGYRGMAVQIKDNQLFIDATDRSMGFTLTFDHVRDQTRYTAHLSDMVEGGDDPFEAEFVFEDDQVVKLGLHLEESLELIWFDKMGTP